MSSRCLRGPLAATIFFVLASAAPHAPAAAGTPPGRPEPTRTDAEVPALQHQSALQRYRRLGDPAALDWRAANAEVARIGGWRAYLKEAHAPEPAASAAATPAARSSTTPSTTPPTPHHGHGHGHGHHGDRR